MYNMPAQSWNATGFEVIKSTIGSKTAGIEVFARVLPGKAVTLERNGTLIKESLFGNMDLDSSYRNKWMYVNVKKLQTYALCIGEGVKSCDVSGHHPQGVPAVVNQCNFLNKA